MALRGITEEMVAETLVDPDQTGTGYQARHLAYRRYRNGRIKVVYVDKGHEIIVVTVLWER